MKNYIFGILNDIKEQIFNTHFKNNTITREKLKTEILFKIKNKYPDDKIEVICDNTNNPTDIVISNCICFKIRYNFYFGHYDEINRCIGHCNNINIF